jgi:type IV secretory pathway VirB10-like protein
MARKELAMKRSFDVSSAGRSEHLERLVIRLREEPTVERSAQEAARLEARVLAGIDRALSAAPESSRSAAPESSRSAAPESSRSAAPESSPRFSRWLEGGAAGVLIAAVVLLGLWALGTPGEPEPISAEPPTRPRDRAGLEVSRAPAPAPDPTSAPSAARSAAPPVHPRVAERRAASPQRAEARPSISSPAEENALPNRRQSTLNEENLLFEAAVEAERRGDLDQALVSLEHLLTSNPRSPLAQQAMVRRFRALQRAGRSEAAASAAQAYLKAYPHGFAAGEARAARDAWSHPDGGTP